MGRVLRPLAAVLCGLVCYGFGRFVLIDSDEANFAHAARDMAAGNWLLHGWSLPPDDFWTLDLGLMALWTRVFGAGPTVPHAVAALIFAGLVGAALTLSGGGMRRALPVLLFVGLPSYLTRGPVLFVTFTPYHLGTLCACLWGLVLLDRPGGWGRVAGLFAVCLAIFVGDFLGVVVFVLPMAAVLLARRGPFWPVWVAGAAWIGAIVMKHAIARAGGFHTAPLPPAFLPLDAVPARLGIAAEALVSFFGIDVFGRTLFGHHYANALPGLLRLPAFACVAAVLSRAWREMRGRGVSIGLLAEGDLVSTLLALGAGLDVVAALLAEFHLVGGDGVRYFYPAFVFSVILFARLAPRVPVWPFAGALLGCGVLTGLAWREWRLHPAPFVDPFRVGHQPDETPVLRALAAQGARSGIAGYWDAGALQFASGGRLSVLAVHPTEGACGLAPRVWISPQVTLGPGARVFVVTRALPVEAFNALSEAGMIAAFGMPEAEVSAGPGTVIGLYARERVIARCPGLAG